ncbi:hypothetical protein FHG55_23685 [Pseudomonas jessenii]|uniref:Secreted protein n=2 Tax=Pseudomonas jessenii TaxID=77298 RepID=A0A5C4KRS1_PSEJE|nr:hypothetical protein FHG55_23685 [Pseudomonas jessenii]
MKPIFLLLPIAALFSAFSVAAAPSPVASFAACDDHSLAVVQSPLFKDLVPSTVENGQIKLSGGTKSDMGQRWMFAKPVEIDGMSLTGFYAEDTDLMGTRIISWGFYAKQTPNELHTQLEKAGGPRMDMSQGLYARAEIWSHGKSNWQPEDPSATAGKLVVDSAERVFLIEPAPQELATGSKGMFTCSIQGKVNEAMLKSSRPDLLSAAH